MEKSSKTFKLLEIPKCNKYLIYLSDEEENENKKKLFVKVEQGDSKNVISLSLFNFESKESFYFYKYIVKPTNILNDEVDSEILLYEIEGSIAISSFINIGYPAFNLNVMSSKAKSQPA